MRRDNLRGWLILGMLVIVVIAATIGLRASRAATRAAAAARASSADNRKLLQERARNDQERTSLIKEVRDQANVIKAQGDRLEALANGQTTILEQVKVISQQVPNCFTPTGQCTAAAKASATNLQNQLMSLRTEVERFFSQQTFIVTNPARPNDQPLIVRPSPCQPALGVGNVGIGTGVACVVPQG